MENCTDRRKDLTGPTIVERNKEIAPVVGGSAQFRAFIEEELFPEINKRYRTTNERSIIGESLSGLFVVETFLLTPEMFDNYIAFHPSLWWNDKYLIKTANEHLSKFPLGDKRFWFASSKVRGMPADVKNLSKAIEKQNIPNLKWKYSNEPKEKHHTIFRATKEKAIIWTFSKSE